MVERNGAVGHSFHLTRDVAGAENEYRLWVLRRGDVAYLIAAWIDRAAADKADGKLAHNSNAPEARADRTIAQIDGIIDRVSFDQSPPATIDLSDLNPRQRQTAGLLYNNLGLFAYNARDFSSAIESFRQAFELQPNDPAVLNNLINAHVELQQYSDALAILEQNIGRFSAHSDLLAARAFLLSRVGETDAALQAYERLFASGNRAEEPFTQYITLLADNGRTSEALAAVEQFLQGKNSFAVQRLQAQLHRQRGEHRQAVAILTELARNRPFNAELSYDLADSLWAVDRYHEALDVCRQLLEHHYDTAQTYLLQARSQYALKLFAEARKSLEAAQEHEPANKEVQELLALVTANLGQGNTSGTADPIDPVPWPESVAAIKAAPSNESQFRTYGAYLLRRQVALRFEPAKEFAQTDRRVIRVLDPSGVTRYSTIQVSFDPVGEQIYVNSLRVLDAHGVEVAAGKNSDYFVVDGATAERPTQAKILNIPVPGLQPGRTIELVFTRRDLSPPNDFPYTAFTFSSDVPVLTSALYVNGDESKIRFNASPGVRMTRVEQGIIWSMDDPLIYRQEPLQEVRGAFLPKVTICSERAKWESLARDYLSSIADRLVPDGAVQKMVEQITRGLSDDDARTAAIAHYVQDYLTYKPIEFGARARVPNRAADTLQNKYGDCKDHALLLLQFLQAAHIPAHLALANLDETVNPQFPALEQFNHMLVYVPGFGGGRCFDCTDKNSDLAALKVPLDLGGDKVLVLDAANPHFIELPDYDATSSNIHVSRTIQLTGQTDANAEETVTVEGYHAAMLRETFKDVPEANRAAVLQEELAPTGGAFQVQTLEINHLLDRNKPLVFKATYLLRNTFKDAGGTLLGQLPALWERMYLGAPSVPDRRTPFVVEFPLEFSTEVDVRAPENYGMQSLASRDDRGQNKFAKWKMHAQPTPQGESIHYELHLASGHYAAADYKAYDDELDRALAALSPTVALKRVK